MFWSLFTFRGHLTREPASNDCNDEQGDLFYSTGPQRSGLATANTGKTREIFGKKCR